MLVIRQREDTPRFARLHISPTCPNTIREFGLYRRKRDPRNREAFLDDIEDRNNHAMDAIRYAIFNRFGGPDRRRGGVPHEAIG
jgi:phage terminase large subunit